MMQTKTFGEISLDKALKKRGMLVIIKFDDNCEVKDTFVGYIPKPNLINWFKKTLYVIETSRYGRLETRHVMKKEEYGTRWCAASWR